MIDRSFRVVLFSVLLLVACGGPESLLPTELEGVWEGTSTGGDDRWTLIVTGERFFLQGSSGREWMKGSLEIESFANLRNADLAVDECDCDFEGQRILGLYRIDGASLTIASAGPGEPRPATLEPAGQTRVFHLTRIGM